MCQSMTSKLPWIFRSILGFSDTPRLQGASHSNFQANWADPGLRKKIGTGRKVWSQRKAVKGKHAQLGFENLNRAERLIAHRETSTCPGATALSVVALKSWRGASMAAPPAQPQAQDLILSQADQSSAAR
jgi:hypothetical protein